MSFATNQGLFINETPDFDVSQLQDVNVNSPEFKELLVRLYQQVNNIATAVNLKSSGYHVTTEFVTGELYFSSTNNPLTFRPIYRLVVDTGMLALGVNPGVPHGLTIASTWSFIEIYGAANDFTSNNYYPLPWPSAGGAANIEVKVNATNIVITNNSGQTFAKSEIILRYIKT